MGMNFQADMELLLLVIRSCMKLSIRNILQYFLQNRKSLFPKNILNEFRFLLNDYKQDRFRDILLKSGLPLSESRLLAFIEKLNNKTLTIANILLLRFHIFKSLRPFRYQSCVKSCKKAFKIMIHTLPVINRIWPLPQKKFNGRGRFFSLVGADGSGKTTLVKDLEKWLSWKLQVRTLYFGIPKTLSLKIVNKLITFLRFPARIGLKKAFAPVVNLGHYVSARRWIWIAGKRLQIYLKAFAWTEKGIIVISDRYPLREFRNMASPMDGPRIQKEWGSADIKLAHLEQHYYSQIRLPDKVFVLKTDINELRKRKKDLDFHSHQEKAEKVNSIKESSHISIINADRAYPVVLKELKQRIWAIL